VFKFGSLFQVLGSVFRVRVRRIRTPNGEDEPSTEPEHELRTENREA